jgi:hypothetical protein
MRTYAGDDFDFLLPAFCHLERGDRAVELDLDVARFLHGVLQPLDERRQAVLPGEHAGCLHVLRQLEADVDFFVHGPRSFNVVGMRKSLWLPVRAFVLQLEVSPKRGAVPAFELPAQTQQCLRTQLPDVAGVDTVEDGRDDVVGNALVNTACKERADCLVGQRRRPLGLHGLLDHAHEAVEDARPP